MRQVVSILAVSMLAGACAQRVADTGGSESSSLSAPTQVLGTVLTCKSEDQKKELSSLRLERGLRQRLWLKGHVLDENGFPMEVNAMVSKVAVSGNKKSQPRFNLEQGIGTLKTSPTAAGIPGISGEYVRSLASLSWKTDVVVLTNFDNSQHQLRGKCTGKELIVHESDSRTPEPKVVWPELEPILEVDCHSKIYGPVPVRVDLSAEEEEGGEGICTPSGRFG